MLGKTHYPVAARVSRSFRLAIIDAARREGVTVSEYIKRALQERIGVNVIVNATHHTTRLVAPAFMEEASSAPVRSVRDTMRAGGFVELHQ